MTKSAKETLRFRYTLPPKLTEPPPSRHLFRPPQKRRKWRVCLIARVHLVQEVALLPDVLVPGQGTARAHLVQEVVLLPDVPVGVVLLPDVLALGQGIARVHLVQDVPLLLDVLVPGQGIARGRGLVILPSQMQNERGKIALVTSKHIWERSPKPLARLRKGERGCSARTRRTERGSLTRQR